MKYSRLFSCAASVLLTFALTGCASVSLVNREWKVPVVPVPELICVRPFGVELDEARVDRSGPELETFARQFGQESAGRLAERISKYVVPSKVIGASERVTNPNHWVIEGRFVRMNQGSRALRSVVGFGLGGTRLESVTDIYRVDARGRRELLARFETTGGSNAEPGMLFSSPIGALPRLAASAAATGLAADARRTTRMITAAISEKLSAQGVRLVGRPLRAKNLSPQGRQRLQ